METIFLFIFFIILIGQFILAISSIFSIGNLEHKFKFVLSHSQEAVKTLEYYIKVFKQIDVQVDAPIKDIAIAEENTILINKKKIYNKDLFSNFFLIFQLELTAKEYNSLRNSHIIHNFLFFLQITAIVAYLVVANFEFTYFFLILAILFQTINIILSFWNLDKMQTVLDISMDKAQDLLDFDDIDLARADHLARELRYKTFDYPVDLFIKIIRFILPI